MHLTATSLLLLGSLTVVPSSSHTLEWGSCQGDDRPKDLQCASIQVPLDWKKPQGRTLTLRIARLPATGAGRGTVFSIPGGPGGSGIDDLSYRGATFSALREQFDVVSFEPRNATTYGRLPVRCFATGPWLTRPDTPGAYAKLGAKVRRSAQECRKLDPAFFDHLDSASVAQDIDAVRSALGQKRLSFVATSYGGVPAVAYARLFPHRVRAMYLDGAVNQLRDAATDARVRYRTYEAQFGRFVSWCESVDVCGKDMGGRWRTLVAKADRAPIPVKGRPDGEKVTYSGFDLQVAAMPNLVGPGPAPAYPRWRQLAAAVRQAERGDAAGFADYVHAGVGSLKPPSFVGMNATQCADGLRFRGYREYRAVRAMGERVSPNLAGMGLWHRLGCTGYPVPVSNPAKPLPSGLPPFLGAGTWTDHDDTADIVGRVPGSATVRFDGHGHGLYLTGNACVIAHANAYLTDLRLPPAGTTCHPPKP
ncbi:alpha/beta hydrolase [Nonomuraea sp. KC401]|uniref:alpha/beta fold hydrolase n=1 Tax=unclassified Nonomuraea TaxID=2593643 RepID=UPI0010FCF92A|nr:MULTISPECIES: alpha/beta fold hydrolase [unclassified Nonomuraea]NBE95587.1 alpha/beta fold hydrolase [Nonomuraea sp. K271]TLF56440.1 alpha/beta hydrolase [Nonomuraea sp. KC401]